MVKNHKNHENGNDLDESETKIVRELIRNPRVSDNQISKKTKVPVMTVNRKRKALEKEGLLRYYTCIDETESGLKIFGSKKMFTIKFKIGITRKKYMEVMESDSKWRLFNSKYISMTYLGDKDGRLALILILDAKDDDHMVEEFNGKIVPFIQEKFGKECIKEIQTVNLNKLIRVHHNYMPHINMENGIIKNEWLDDMIFVNEVDGNNGSEKADNKLEKFL